MGNPYEILGKRDIFAMLNSVIPVISQALKKLLCAGAPLRKKTATEDLREARNTLKRALKMHSAGLRYYPLLQSTPEQIDSDIELARLAFGGDVGIEAAKKVFDYATTGKRNHLVQALELLKDV